MVALWRFEYPIGLFTSVIRRIFSGIFSSEGLVLGIFPPLPERQEVFGSLPAADSLNFGEFELVQGIHRGGNHIEDVAATKRLGQDIGDTCRFEHGAHTAAGNYAGPCGGRLEQHTRAADPPKHFVRDCGFENRHFMQVLAGVFRSFAHGIGNCIGFANTHPDTATVIADHDRHAERKPPTAFDNFCYTSDIYHALVQFLSARKLVAPPVILSGVSEGAGLAVLAASAASNHEWAHGVMTMGLPPTAELGWRWTDFTSWITKKDTDEPMFAPKDFVPGVSPLPLCMIQSTTDEYVAEADYRLFERVARDPKKLVLINASNHRFTDRRPELQREVVACLAWMAGVPRQ